jgi:hypothetical protein
MLLDKYMPVHCITQYSVLAADYRLKMGRTKDKKSPQRCENVAYTNYAQQPIAEAKRH